MKIQHTQLYFHDGSVVSIFVSFSPLRYVTLQLDLYADAQAALRIRYEITLNDLTHLSLLCDVVELANNIKVGNISDGKILVETGRTWLELYLSGGVCVFVGEGALDVIALPG
jgi:hypothetical protein